MLNITQNYLQQLHEVDDYLWLEATIKLLKTKNLENFINQCLHFFYNNLFIKIL